MLLERAQYPLWCENLAGELCSSARCAALASRRVHITAVPKTRFLTVGARECRARSGKTGTAVLVIHVYRYMYLDNRTPFGWVGQRTLSLPGPAVGVSSDTDRSAAFTMRGG